MEPETKTCQNCKKDFTIEPEDFNFYEKIKVPPPTFCPLCRAQRRLSFRNERNLFKVKDFFTDKNIFSLYPEENCRSITEEVWHSDKFDASEYARDYDFSKNFFKQFFELKKEIPVAALRVQMMVNSPYCANATELKNCHLCFNSSFSENCMYSNASDFSKDSMDNSHINHSERCYECFWLQNCYQCYFTIMSAESSNLWFCRDCSGCNDCFGCVGLRKSSYCIFNKQYSKEEYKNELEKMMLNSTSGILIAKEKARKFWLNFPLKCSQGIKNVNSTGSYVTNCKNVKESFLMREGEDVKYSQYLQIPKSKDCYDASAWGNNMELHYETCLSGYNSYNLKFTDNCWPNCKNLEYCAHVFSSSDCFGCVGLKKKQYCVFNKQYTKEDYQKIVEKIKKQMNEIPYIDRQGLIYGYGEYFPIELTSYGYNNSISFLYFPMTKNAAIEKGYPWIDVPHGKYKITVKASELPDSAADINEKILEEVIECQNCGYPFRILENELIFYKNENLPVPKICHECRYEIRIKDRLKLELYNRKCMCSGLTDETRKYKNGAKHFHGENSCNEEFRTGYNPEGAEIVYCEKCYQQEVY